MGNNFSEYSLELKDNTNDFEYCILMDKKEIDEALEIIKKHRELMKKLSNLYYKQEIKYCE
jgi:hypothetical protein